MARQINEQDIEYAIYEVYYKDDVPDSYSTNSTRPHMYHDESDDPAESLKWYLEAMLKASEKPVLDYDNFPNVYQKYYRKMKLKQIIKSKLNL
jgi:hypothetical protein